MTGLELIDYIHKYQLEDVKIIGSDANGIKFETKRVGVDFELLWLHDDLYKDVIFNYEGDLTDGWNKRRIVR